jgi:hypothetical protein
VARRLTPIEDVFSKIRFEVITEPEPVAAGAT